MSSPWTFFSAADGLPSRHFDAGQGNASPPYLPGGSWREGRFTRDGYRLVDGEVVERPAVPCASSGAAVADGASVLTLSGIPAGAVATLVRDGAAGAGWAPQHVFHGTLDGDPFELTFTTPGTYRLFLVLDPTHRPTPVVIEVAP